MSFPEGQAFSLLLCYLSGMASVDLLNNLRGQETGVKEGVYTLFDVQQLFVAYLRALAAEKGLVLPEPVPSVDEYTLTVGRYAGGSLTYEQMQSARTALVDRIMKMAKVAPKLSRAGGVKAQLDAAVAAKAPQATIDALKARYTQLLGQETATAQKAVDVAASTGANPNVVKDLQKRLDAAKTAEASGKLATNPMKEVLTFAILTSPAWVPLLLMRHR